MAEPTYRIPGTGLYLEPDGRVAPKPREAAAVVDATEEMARQLTAAYVGKGLQIMSNTGGVSPSGDSTAESLKHLGEGLETVVLIGDIAEMAIGLAKFMGAFAPQKDSALVMLEQIDSRLDAIDDAVLATWAASRDDQLALLRGKAATALSAAQKYLELNRPQDTFWQSRMALADRDSEEAVKVYTESGIDGGFWKRPFSLQAMGISPNAVHLSWLQFHPERDQILASSRLKHVWDYRFALPALVYAVIARIAVLRAVRPQSLQHGEAGCREIEGYARFLREVVARIQGGIWNLNALAADEGSRFAFLWHGRAPVAAAQMHSGYGLMRVVYAYEWEFLHPSDPALWPSGLREAHTMPNHAAAFAQVDKNIAAVGSHWWHLIWRDIGMVEMCKILSDIDAACTQPIFSRWIGGAQERLIRASSDATSRSAASMATGLVRLTSEGDAALDSARTFNVFEALRRDDDKVREVLLRTAAELTALSSEPEVHRLEPVGWWRGEESTRDSAGENDGHAVGDLGFVEGKRGQAFGFLRGAYIEVPNAPALEPGNLTLVAWVRRDAAPDPSAYLLSKGAEECTAASYALYVGEHRGLIFYVSNGHAVDYSPGSSSDIWDNGWHFVAGTYDGESVRLYLDGTEVGTPTAATIEGIEYGLSSGDAFNIGAYHGTCDQRFDDGHLDEVRIYDRALTPEEIRALYTSEA